MKFAEQQSVNVYKRVCVFSEDSGGLHCCYCTCVFLTLFINMSRRHIPLHFKDNYSRLIWLWAHVVVASSSRARILGECLTIHSLRFFFFGGGREGGVEISSHTLIPLFCARISLQWLSKLRQLWPNVPWQIAWAAHSRAHMQPMESEEILSSHHQHASIATIM